MRRCLHYGFLLLLLFTLGQWPRIAGAAALEPGCVVVELSDSPPISNLQEPPGPNPNRMDFTLTNGCGKDVTAVAVQLRPVNGDPSAVGPITLDSLDALVIPADERSGDILHSGQSSTHQWVNYPEKGFSASSLSASVTCVLFLDRTAVGDKQDIRRVLDHRSMAYARRFQLGQQILAKISDFDTAAVYFRDAHPVLGSYEEQYVVKFANAFRRTQSRGVWSDYIAQQTAMIEQLIALYKEHSQLSAKNH
jgi:hypothetical protein